MQEVWSHHPGEARRSLVGAVVRACAAVSLGLVTVGLAAPPARAIPLAGGRRAGGGGPHPDPRPGIDASHMARPETAAKHPGAAAAFDEARTIPGILDGIRCHCGCADDPAMRSLLSCYEGEDAMALQCDICQGQARLAFRLQAKGQSLDRIRAAVDARYGG